VVITCGILTLIAFACADQIATHWINVGQSVNKELVVTSIRMMALVFVPHLALGLYTAGLIGLERQIQANLIQSLFVTAKSGLVLFPIIWRPDLSIYFSWQVTTTFLFALIARAALMTNLAAPVFTIGVPDFDRLKPYIRFALGMFTISLIASVNTQLNKIVVSKLFSIKIFGYFTLASTIAQLPGVLTAPVGAALLPRLTALVSQGRRANLIKTYEDCSYLIASLSTCGAIAVMAFPQEILSVWLIGESFPYEVAIAARFLALGGMYLALATGPFYLGIANGHNTTSVLLGLVTLLVTVPLLQLSIARYGLLGATAPWIFVNAAALIVLTSVVHKRYYHGRSYRWWVRCTFVPITCNTVAMLFARQIVQTFQLRPSGACITIAAFAGLSIGLLTTMWRRNTNMHTE
jgi:O-antigen/teichoic acid export membrane protein